MPRTFWCFMKKKRGYNLVWHTVPNYFMSQLSWTKGSEKKIMKKGLIVNKGKLQTGLHYSLWVTRASSVSTVGFLSMTENSITFTQKKGKSWVQGELQFITKGQFFSQNLVAEWKDCGHTDYFFHLRYTECVRHTEWIQKSCFRCSFRIHSGDTINCHSSGVIAVSFIFCNLITNNW